jgi:maltose alpha-D-glucosyltransferase / alpha-amylase
MTISDLWYKNAIIYCLPVAKYMDADGDGIGDLDDRTFGYERVNVADQRRDPNSLLNWTERMIRMRKECPEISWGDFEVMSTSASEVLATRYDFRETSLLTMHNLADRRVQAAFDLNVPRGDLLVDVFNANGDSHGRSEIALEPYAWRWFRLGSPDNALYRAAP